jgi:superfamily I DNA/RNA helicase
VPEFAGHRNKRPEGNGADKWHLACDPCENGVIADPAPTVKHSTFPPTDEQLIAKSKFLAGETFALLAFAGAGKTSTFVLLAESTDRTGQYIAYNNAIAKEAGARFPKSCPAATLHAIARRQVGHHYTARLDKDAKRLSSTQQARLLGLKPFTYTDGDGTKKVVQPNKLAGYVQTAIKWFCTTADTNPSVKHIRYVEGIDEKDSDGKRTYANNKRLQAHIEPALQIAWDDIVDTDGQLQFTHDHYLKIWELGIWGVPKIPGDYILFDEAQDANPVFISAVQKQGVQVVWCGDSNQAIYQWRGAVDALKIVDVDSTSYLTQSFRFGPEIAEVANKILEQVEDFDAEHPVVGSGKPGSIGPCDDPDAVLCRSNAGAIQVTLNALKDGKKVHLVSGASEIAWFAREAKKLQEGRPSEHPDLGIFSSWTEVQDYVRNDPQGEDLKIQVKLIDDFGADDVIAATDNKVSEEDADVVVSTAHKSKGREWDKVQLAGDFGSTADHDEALFLVYVAATRGKLHLDFEACQPVREIFYGEGEDL